MGLEALTKKRQKMGKRIFALLGISSLLICSCSMEESVKDTPSCSTDVSASGTYLKFITRNADNAGTKMSLQDGGSVYWSPSDEISIFYGSSAYGKFTSSNTEATPTTEFAGFLKGYQNNGEDSFWAVHPYSEKNECDGKSVTVTLPSEQNAVAGTFDDDCFISIAKSDDFNLAFYNLCGGVKFQVPEEGIKSIIFSGLNNEVLAGTATVKLDDDGKPYVESVAESTAATSIKLNAPDGGTFQTGVYYCMVSLPAELSSGYRMRFEKEKGNSVLKGGKSVSIRRNTWGVLSESITSRAKDNYIAITCSADSATVRIFSDANHAQYEYLTLSEGENVIPGPDYGFDFWWTGSSTGSNGKIIKRDLSEGCINQDYVTSVDLSHWDASLVTDASHMFNFCCSLTAIPDLPDMPLVTDARYMFFNCNSLTSTPDVSKMTKVTNASGMFAYCSSLTTPPDVSNMTEVTDASSMFFWCSGLTTPPDVSNMTEVTDARFMFSRCSGLTTPPDVSNMTEVTDARFMFSECSGLTTPPDVSNMAKVTDAYFMFEDCSNMIATPDMSKLAALKDVKSMFRKCTSLATAQIGSLDFSSGLDYDSIFEDTPSLRTVISKCANEAHLSALKSHLEETHSYKKVVTQGETSAEGVTVFTIDTID